MSLDFDAVLPRLLTIGTRDPVMVNATAVAVVRDTRGLVRLALDAPRATEAERESLERTLEHDLGAWYSGPVLYKDGTAPQRRIAETVLARARGHWPAAWPEAAEDVVTGGRTPIDQARWGAVERVLSKESWLIDRTVSSPWPLHAKTPTIVSFYSYKGGVGRSTLVAVVAALLARAGKKVVVVDLDLEAPGQYTLFGVAPRRGVIDYIVEHLAVGKSDLDGLVADATGEIPGASGSVSLVPAGGIGWSYVEKIARLDFVGHTQGEEDSPVHEALVDLLKTLKRTHAPDWILLDARTGIHDLGGLAIHALAHIDVLLARGGQQGRDGLRLSLEALTRRRKQDDILTLVVHALAPAPLSDEAISKPLQQQFRRDVYDIFKETAYAELDDSDIPAEDDASAAHAPYAVPLDPTLGRIELLREMTDATVNLPHYAKIVERLVELAVPDEDT